MITRRVHGPAQVSNAAATKFTIPAGYRGVITRIHCNNPSLTTAIGFTWSIGADAAATRLKDAFLIAPGADYDDNGPFTMEATEVIQAFASVNNVLVLTIDMELQLV